MPIRERRLAGGHSAHPLQWNIAVYDRGDENENACSMITRPSGREGQHAPDVLFGEELGG